MADNDVQALKDRLTTLEVTVKEKWESHDRRADERWADLMDKMHEVAGRTTPCKEHVEAMTDLKARTLMLEKKVSFIETATWASIGLVVVGGLLTLAIKHITG